MAEQLPLLYYLLLFQSKQRQQSSSSAGCTIGQCRRMLLFTNSPTCLADTQFGWPGSPGCSPEHGTGSPCSTRSRQLTRGYAAAKARARAVSEGFGWAFSDAFPRHGHQIGALPEMNRVRLQPVSPLRSRAPPLQRWLNLSLTERTWLETAGPSAVASEKVALGKTPFNLVT